MNHSKIVIAQDLRKFNLVVDFGCVKRIPETYFFGDIFHQIIVKNIVVSFLTNFKKFGQDLVFFAHQVDGLLLNVQC